MISEHFEQSFIDKEHLQGGIALKYDRIYQLILNRNGEVRYLKARLKNARCGLNKNKVVSLWFEDIDNGDRLTRHNLKHYGKPGLCFATINEEEPYTWALRYLG